MSLGIQAQTAEFETAAEAVKNMKVGWTRWYRSGGRVRKNMGIGLGMGEGKRSINDKDASQGRL